MQTYDFDFDRFIAEWQEDIRRFCSDPKWAAEMGGDVAISAARALDDLKGKSPKVIQYYCRWRATQAAGRGNYAKESAWFFLSRSNSLLEYKQRIVFLRITFGEMRKGIKWEQ